MNRKRIPKQCLEWICTGKKKKKKKKKKCKALPRKTPEEMTVILRARGLKDWGLEDSAKSKKKVSIKMVIGRCVLT